MDRNRIHSQSDTKSQIIALAREQGVEEKVKKLLVKYEDLCKHARTEDERKVLAAEGLVMIHKTIGCVGPLVVDGVELVPADPAYKDQIAMHMACTKLD